MRLATSGGFTLRFVDGRYKAGCRNFTYLQAVRHRRQRAQFANYLELQHETWVRRRARRFLAAIEQHHRELTAPKRRRVAKKAPARKARKQTAVRSRRKSA